jgi:hypothetical protein
MQANAIFDKDGLILVSAVLAPETMERSDLRV